MLATRMRVAAAAEAESEDGLQMLGSINFNGSDEYLTLSNFSSSSPDQKTFTVSAWVKIDTYPDDGFTGAIFSVRTDANNSLRLLYQTLSGNHNLVYADTQSGSLVSLHLGSTELSTGQWYHFVWRVDTTDGTTENRVRIYIDNVLETEFDFADYAQNDDSYMFENSYDFGIGAFADGTALVDGNIADVIAVEGQSLAPDNFGYDNGGTWSWKDYTGSYGSHGFRINPQDSSEIGTDQSGNGYNFTLNNMDTGNFDSGDLPPT